MIPIGSRVELLKDVHRGGTTCDLGQHINLRDHIGFVDKCVPESCEPGWGHFDTFYYLIFPSVSQRWRTARAEVSELHVRLIEEAPEGIQKFFARVRYPRFYRIIELYAFDEDHVKYLLNLWYDDIVIHKIGLTREATYVF